MRLLHVIVALLVSCATSNVHAAEVFAQPPSASGGVNKSSWYSPEGLDGDIYAFDSFTLTTNAAISEVRWRGGYTNYLQGAGRAPVYAFTISIYRSGTGGFNPDLGAVGRLVKYEVMNNCGEVAVGTFGGVIMYDYAFALPVAFQATAGTKYWVQIEAWQGLTPVYYWPPDWGLCTGTGGNGSYFRRVVGGQYQTIGGDLAFSLFSSDAPTVTINASANPALSGNISGAGVYPVNSTAQLIATANAGWGFVNWTENGSQVSSNPRYTFAATADLTLVAQFTPAYSVTTTAYPEYGGTTSGDGVFNSGSTVTVLATPNPGFVFAGWLGYSGDAAYSFPATQDVALVALFDSAPGSVTFNLDDAPVHTSLPVSVSNNGLSAWLSATGSGFSIQPYGSVGLAPAGMSGLYLYPNSVFPADLHVAFSEPLTFFSILYAPQELGCDDSATMRVTAYLDGVFVATDTATAPVPGNYPTGTLSISTVTGFDNVVVHYESRPPLCQDWGPIFLADIITVTRACAPAGIGQDPAPAVACRGGAATFSVTPSGSGPFSFAWRFNGTPIDQNINPSAGTDLLSLHGVSAADAGAYDCEFSNACGAGVSGAATLRVIVDVNGDDTVNTADLVLLLGLYGQEVGPAEPVDANGDGVINTNDLVLLLGCFGETC